MNKNNIIGGKIHKYINPFLPEFEFELNSSHNNMVLWEKSQFAHYLYGIINCFPVYNIQSVMCPSSPYTHHGIYVQTVPAHSKH